MQDVLMLPWKPGQNLKSWKAEAGATESRTKCRTKLRRGRLVRSAAVSRQKAGSWAQTTEQVLQKAGNKTEWVWDTNCKFRLQRFRPLAGAPGSHPNQSKKVERAKCWLKRFANMKIPARSVKTLPHCGSRLIRRKETNKKHMQFL